MKLGPIQEWWLMRLEMYPERQTDAILGKRSGNTGLYQACCLGELLICYKLYNGASFDDLWREDILWHGDTTIYELRDADADGNDSSDEILAHSWRDIGLHGADGDALESFDCSFPDGETTTASSLAEANDDGLSWPEIAKIVRANPENFFSKSV